MADGLMADVTQAAGRKFSSFGSLYIVLSDESAQRRGEERRGKEEERRGNEEERRGTFLDAQLEV